MTEVTCSVNDCDSPLRRKGYCRKHYVRWRRHGDPDVVIKPQVRGRVGCIVDGCDRPHSSGGYCRAHYVRQRKTGTPGVAEISRARGKQGHAVRGAEARCRDCGETKPASEYYGRRDGKKVQPCKECVKAERKAWRDANSQLLRERMVGYRLRFNSGITTEQYEALLAAQGGGCGICGQRQPAAGKRRLHVDHDHETGAIRGVLCGGCNTAIGLFGEDIRLMIRAAEYLERAA